MKNPMKGRTLLGKNEGEGRKIGLRRRTCLFACAVAFALTASGQNLRTQVTNFSVTNVTLKEALQQLEKQAAESGMTDRVDFLGARNDVDYLLAESSIFVIPSRCEGFPNALCEAMASPLPCIAFDSISASDIIENRVNGVVLHDGDIDGLANEIRILMDNENLRNSYAWKAYSIRDRLNKEKIGDMFLEFILEKYR